MRGIDGYGWTGHDKFGNFIEESDAEMDSKSRQRGADARVPEKLYVCEEYRLFFLTAQDTGGDGRKAYISARAFHMLEPDTVDKLKAAAEPWEKAKLRESMVDITPDFEKRQLIFEDGTRSTRSTIAFSDLDPDVGATLATAASNAGGWAKYFGPQHAFAAAATKGVAPMKPVSFQRKAFTL